MNELEKIQFDEKNGAVYDPTVYSIGKDIDGKELTTKDIHDSLLKILDELDRVCRKNNIPYALAFGSALGLHNYHGFIPWDDDMDVAIDYFDIPRLIEAFQKDLSKDFYFDCYETDKRYNVLIPTFKLRMRNTYIKEINCFTLPNRCKQGDGIFIDIVAFMGVPKDHDEHYKLIKYCKNKMPWYVFVDGFLRIHPYGMKKKIKVFEQKAAEKYRDSSNVAQTVIIPFQDWGDEKDKMSYPKDIIYPFREYDFYGRKVYSFNKLEDFCRLCYGEKSLRRWDGTKWYDPYPENRKHAGHARAISLSREKKAK